MPNKLLISFQVLLATIYFSSGLSKFLQWFPNIIGPNWLISELSKYDLGLFGVFIGLSQLIVGGLLFFPALRLIASLLLLPIHSCITVVTLSLGWQGTPYINLVLLMMILALLYDDREKLAGLYKAREFKKENKRFYLIVLFLCGMLAVTIKYGALIR